MIHLYFKKSIINSGWKGDKHRSGRSAPVLDRAGVGFHYGNGSKDEGKGQTQDIFQKQDFIMNGIYCVQDEGIKNDSQSLSLSTAQRKVEFKELLFTGRVSGMRRDESVFCLGMYEI